MGPDPRNVTEGFPKEWTSFPAEELCRRGVADVECRLWIAVASIFLLVPPFRGRSLEVVDHISTKAPKGPAGHSKVRPTPYHKKKKKKRKSNLGRHLV